MEEKQQVIADFDMSLIISFFKGMNRQGPGEDASTLKAIQLLPSFGSDSKILDIGCGSGSQTLVLADKTDAKIVATDISSDLLAIFRKKTDKYKERITTVEASMEALPFKNDEFDAIWAEGSIFIMGFREGLKQWRKFLKDNGYIIISEASWFTVDRPKEIEDYWMENYPQIAPVSECIEIMEEEGYKPIAHFLLPECGWIENYYVDMKRQIEEFEKKYPDNPNVKDFLSRQKKEIAMYDKYKKYYGYVFYIGQKINI